MSSGPDHLERDLRALSTGLWPDTPDVAAAVLRRIETPSPARRRRPTRPQVAIALAVLLAATAAALAVPQARTAILRALGLGSVRVELVDDLPPAAPSSDLSLLGLPVTREQAAARFPYPLLDVESSLGEPDELRLGYDDASLTYVWRDGPAIRLLVSQLPGRVMGSKYVKTAGPGATVEAISVEGRPALWIAGDAHGFGLIRPDGEVVYEDLRLSGNALLVDDGDVTIRIEGDLDRERAVAIARDLL